MVDTKARVLVVDDRHSIVWFIQHVLEREGFDIITAVDGAEGLRKILDEKPDMVILDTVMPRMDGYKVYHHMKEKPDTAHIPVLFLTLKGKNDRRKANILRDRRSTLSIKDQKMNDGNMAIDFLNKPFTAEEIVERVNRLWSSNPNRRNQEPVSPKARILIIDDTKSLVLLAENILRKEGFDVITAFDGLEGLQKVRDEQPDLIILDIVMPELDGFQVLHLVRQQTKIPVIMLTSDNDMDSVKKTLGLGADGYVVKPVSSQDLLARIREKLEPTETGPPR